MNEVFKDKMLPTKWTFLYIHVSTFFLKNKYIKMYWFKMDCFFLELGDKSEEMVEVCLKKCIHAKIIIKG